MTSDTQAVERLSEAIFAAIKPYLNPIARHADVFETLRALIAQARSSEGVEPFAWFIRPSGVDEPFFAFSTGKAAAWRRNGASVKPLYLSPFQDGTGG